MSLRVAIKGLVIAALLAVVLGASFHHLSGIELVPDGPTAADRIGPTAADRILAWTAKGVVAAILGIGMPLLIIGAVRRSPMQEWMLPNADELQHAADRVEAKTTNGVTLTTQDCQFLAGLAIRSGLTVLAIMVFAGFLVLRM